MSVSTRGAKTTEAPRLLDQLRHQIRLRHYSYRTEQAYIGWTKRFIRFHSLKHPAEMGGPEVESYLSYLASERNVAAATQSQALSAVMFLYKTVLKTDLPWLQNVVRATRQHCGRTRGTRGRTPPPAHPSAPGA